MITTNNLKRAGFDRGEKRIYGDGWVRSWTIKPRESIEIEVSESSDKEYNTWLIFHDNPVRLYLTTVTDLLTLAKLLK